MSFSRILCVLAAGFFLFALSRGLASLTVRPPHPQLQVTPTEVDLGTVVVGQPVERAFLIRNGGASRLLITGVKSTCQCTVADLPSRALMPDGSATLRVTFNARSAGGKVQSVTVTSNDPDAPVRIVKLRAQVVATTRP